MVSLQRAWSASQGNCVECPLESGFPAAITPSHLEGQGGGEMPRSSAFLHNHILIYLFFFSPAFNILVNVGVVLTYPILISIGTVLSVPGNAGTSNALLG